ncbi:MAG: ABC transporter substrate-binding protein [Meiothermus silvanus]|nr:ABC transporter substrate-binding protein [Allomeiothermus silvanus]
MTKTGKTVVGIAVGLLISSVVLSTAGLRAVAQGQPVLRIGVNGVMSGPAASWGLVNKYSAETTAAMINAKGGWQIGDRKYRIEIVSLDDRNDPKVSVTNVERLASMGIKYIIGPNVDTTAGAIVPVLERAGIINIPYAFNKDLYSPPRSNSILGMIASYQAGPVIYKYLMEKKGVRTLAFLARNEADPLNQRDEGVAAAKRLGLSVLSSENTYEPGTTNFSQVLSRILPQRPDLLVLSGVAPSDAPLIIKAARELGYRGLISTETAQDAKILQEVAGGTANGFISVGGASTPEIQSKYMEDFVSEYIKRVGEWNDEAGTKVYALEMILRTLALAGPKAINDVEEFKKAISRFNIPNPFLKEAKPLKYVGTAYFKQPRQIGVPMVVNEFRDGKFVTLFVGSVDE